MRVTLDRGDQLLIKAKAVAVRAREQKAWRR